MMKKIHIIFLLLSINGIIFSQSQIPLSRVDSAKIVQHDTLYTKYYNLNDKREACRQLDMNATIYWKHNLFDKAIEYYTKSKELNKQLGNNNGIAGINSNLALIYADKGDYKLAYEYFEKTLAIRKSNNEKVGTISALINEAVVLNKLNEFKLSTTKLEEALSIAQSMNDEKQMRSIYGMLSETYQKAGNSEKALYYYEYYKTFNNYVTDKKIAKKDYEIQQQIMQKQILELENNNKQLKLEKQNWLLTKQSDKIQNITKDQRKLIDSLSKQEMAIKIIQQKNKIQELENKEQNRNIKQQKKITFLISTVLIITIILFVWLFYIYRKKNTLNNELIQKNSLINQQKQEILTQRDYLIEVNELLNEKNSQITSSITYAQRIQNAMLSGSDDITPLFDDQFLLYQPRDIVAGDFYYFKKINNKKLIVVGDCTGHGVPGGFLTVLGINILNSIIYDKHITKPAQILTELDKQFYKMLNQESSFVNDGMDASIALFDNDNSKMEFSGARNAIFISTKNKIEKITANKSSIGYSLLDKHRQKNFDTKIITFEKETWIYMLSDGYADQFDENQKRFTQHKTIEILKNNFTNNGEKQLNQLKNTHDNWKKEARQTDDIILLGINIKK